jgi:hypothetical protein
MAIRRQPLVGSARRGCRTKGLDPARRAMAYLPLTYFFLPLNDQFPPRRTLGQLTSFVEAFSPVLPPRPSPSSRQSLLHCRRRRRSRRDPPHHRVVVVVPIPAAARRQRIPAPAQTGPDETSGLPPAPSQKNCKIGSFRSGVAAGGGVRRRTSTRRSWTRCRKRG